MNQKNILITGGTGLIGKALATTLLEHGYCVTVLSRTPGKFSPRENLQYAYWNLKKNEIDKDALARADYIIHLAGAGVVEKKWNQSYRKEIIDSRTESCSLILKNLPKDNLRLKALISNSAIGWYGPDKTHGHFFTESEPADSHFLGETCRLWEEATDQAEAFGIRVCKIRVGIVLTGSGGAMGEFLKPMRLGVAAIMGGGQQTVSWIHIEDLCRMYLQAIENENMRGVYNAVAPVPVSNRELMMTLGKICRGAFFIPFHVPAWLLRLILGERSVEVLKSATVSCEKIKKTGFTFLFPSIEPAIRNLMRR